MSVSKRNIRIQTLILIAGIIILAGKFSAWIITDSNAILTDALESIINVVAGAFALYSLFLTSKPRDEDHPYGHGKIEFLSSGFEGGLILIAGLVMTAKACYNFFKPIPIDSLDYGIIIIIVTGLVNYLLGTFLQKRGKRDKSIIMIASGQHLMSDAWSTLGLIIGLTIIYFTGFVGSII
jgi:cation diffusion facilitator family transporter